MRKLAAGASLRAMRKHALVNHSMQKPVEISHMPKNQRDGNLFIARIAAQTISGTFAKLFLRKIFEITIAPLYLPKHYITLI